MIIKNNKMKKIAQILAMTLLLSLTVYSQNREAVNGTHEHIVTNHTQGQQQAVMNALSGIDELNPETPLLISPFREWLLMDRTYSYQWDAEQSGWKNTTTYFYYYDENYNLDERLEKSADGLDFIERNRYYYDDNGYLLLEERVSEYDSTEWIPSKKILYSYNVNNDNLIEKLTKKWEDGEYTNYRKTTYTYDNDNNLYQYIAKYSHDGINWANSARWTYFYDQNNNLYKMTNETWDDDGSVWLDFSRNILTRDVETGNLILMISEYWNDEDNIWEEKLRQTYYYNDGGYMTSFVAKSWDDDEHVWKPVFSQVYTYLPAGSEEIMVLNADINKSIDDFQITEDEIIVSMNKHLSRDMSLMGIEVMVDSIVHTSDGDLEFTLSHNGISETLIYYAGGEGDNFINTKLSDRGVDSVSNGVAPFLGIYHAESPLFSFLTTDPTGTWTLSIYDGAEGNTGMLQSWGLNLVYSPGASAIEDGFNKESELSVFPNPACSVVSLRSSVFSQKSSTIEIYDLNGRKLLEKQIPVRPAGTENIEIDVSHLKNGVYFFKLKAGSLIQTKKMILNK